MDKKQLQLITKEDLDVDVMAEVELSRLQRQYRIMEGDRAAYVEEINVKLAKQKKVSFYSSNLSQQLFICLNR